jgi:hypothetical protein
VVGGKELHVDLQCFVVNSKANMGFFCFPELALQRLGCGRGFVELHLKLPQRRLCILEACVDQLVLWQGRAFTQLSLV